MLWAVFVAGKQKPKFVRFLQGDAIRVMFAGHFRFDAAADFTGRRTICDFCLPRYDGKENNIPNPMKDGGTMAELSSAAKEYLRVIYTLGQGAGVRSVDVATELGVSKPSVNKAIRILAARGLVVQERYASVFLTPEGIRMAQSLWKKEDIIRSLLEDIFEVAPEDAQQDAKRIADVIGEKTFEKMRMYFNNFHYNN